MNNINGVIGIKNINYLAIRALHQGIRGQLIKMRRFFSHRVMNIE